MRLRLRITEYIFLQRLVRVREAYIESEVPHLVVCGCRGPSVVSHSINSDQSSGSMSPPSAMDENRLIGCAICQREELAHALLVRRSAVRHRNVYEFHSRCLDLLALLGWIAGFKVNYCSNSKLRQIRIIVPLRSRSSVDMAVNLSEVSYFDGFRVGTRRCCGTGNRKCQSRKNYGA